MKHERKRFFVWGIPITSRSCYFTFTLEEGELGADINDVDFLHNVGELKMCKHEFLHVIETHMSLNDQTLILKYHGVRA